MRKHKSVVAVLLAVMMIFTFMPVMSFATNPTPKNVSSTAKWDSTFSKMTNDKVSYDTYSRIYNQNSGEVVATAGNDNIEGIAHPLYAEATYYDVSKATIGASTSKWTYELFTSRFTEDTGVVSDGLWLTMHKPDNAKYMTGYDATQDAASETAWTNPDYETVFYATGFDKTKVYEDQDVTITALVRTKLTGEQATAANAKLLGSVADTKTITVKAKEGAPSQVKLYVDSVSDSKEIKDGNQFTYDGKAHKVVANEVPGFTTKLALFNNDTKKYEDKEEIEVKDAKTYSIKYIVTKTSDGTENVYYKDLVIGKAAAFKYDFEATVKNFANNSQYPKVPANAEPMDYIVVNGAADSDKEAAMKLFAEVCDVKSAPFKGNEKLAIWTVSIKEGIDFDKVAKNNKALLDNYNGHPTFEGMVSGKASTRVEYTADSAVNSKDDDITFTGLTKQTFKAKKKTKKLAKAKTLAVNVANESGNEMTFSYKTTNKKVTFDAASMKIKVKKGTKKGTYKVTVKAKTAAGNGYKAAKESQTYTIVVK